MVVYCQDLQSVGIAQHDLKKLNLTNEASTEFHLFGVNDSVAPLLKLADLHLLIPQAISSLAIMTIRIGCYSGIPGGSTRYWLGV